MVVKTIQNNLQNGHNWTQQDYDYIRTEYKGTIRSAEIIAKHLSIKYGREIGHYAVLRKAYSLGMKNASYKRWTEKEEEYFAELIGKYPMCEVQRLMEKKGYKRGMQAIKMKKNELKLSSEDRVGWYTKYEVSKMLGVSEKTVGAWIDDKKLKASWHHNKQPSNTTGRAYWHIDEDDLREFIEKHAHDLTGRNVDLWQIVEIFKAALREKK